jgi:hypothetical protein
MKRIEMGWEEEVPIPRYTLLTHSVTGLHAVIKINV